MAAVSIWLTCAIVLSEYDTHKPSLINRLESFYYDLRLNLSLTLKASTSKTVQEKDAEVDENFMGEVPIVILDIDATSLLKEGRWPWSRVKIAHLVETLMQKGAAVIAFDVVFSEPERNPVSEVLAALQAQETSTQSPSNPNKQEQTQKALVPLESQLDADLRLSQLMQDTATVLGFFFEYEKDIRIGQLPNPLLTLPKEKFDALVVLKQQGFTASLPVLAQSAANSGFVTTFTDPDGIVRHSPLVIGHEQGIYPSLSLAAAMAYLFLDEAELQMADISDIHTLTAVRIAQDWIPTDARGFVNIPYPGPRGHYPYISATNVLQGKDLGDSLQDALVFVGTSAIGLADLRSTPMGPQYPGVEIHAAIADALINGGFTHRPDWEAGATQVVLILSILGLIAIFHGFGSWGMVLGGALMILGLVGFNFYLWHVEGLDLPGATLVIAPTLVSVFYIAEGFLRESHQRRKLKSMFDQYVPPVHIEHMIDDPESYGFQGEFKEMSVLFSDIRGFTQISEKLSANQLKQMLNDYFTPITEAIFDQGGTIDKYVGDMVMAFWGAPVEDDQHPQHAVEAALEMLKVTEALREGFKAQGLPEIRIGIGINTGHMNVGDMGSTFRRAYTVIGDAVNLGSRLESITKFYGVPLLISETTCQRLEGYLCQRIDKIRVKGKEEPVCVYCPWSKLSDAEDELVAEMALWDETYGLYLERKWTQAQSNLLKLVTLSPREVYKVYSKRIPELVGQDLPDDWDGTFTHTSK